MDRSSTQVLSLKLALCAVGEELLLVCCSTLQFVKDKLSIVILIFDVVLIVPSWLACVDQLRA